MSVTLRSSKSLVLFCRPASSLVPYRWPVAPARGLAISARTNQLAVLSFKEYQAKIFGSFERFKCEMGPLFADVSDAQLKAAYKASITSMYRLHVDPTRGSVGTIL